MDLRNPFEKIRCLYCNEEIYLGDCRILSGTTSGKVLYTPPTYHGSAKGGLVTTPFPSPSSLPMPAAQPTAPATAPAVARQPGKLNTIFHRMRVKTPKNFPSRELAYYECANCGKRLPSNTGRVEENITIAVIGDLTAGKTHYITALLHQLQQLHIPEGYGYINVRAADQEIEIQYIRDYYRPLFELKQSFARNQPATTSIADPWIYELRIERADGSSNSVNIVLYDASGEDLYNQISLVKYRSHILAARGIIYLADPGQMPRLLDGVRHGKRPDGSAPHRASQNLQWAIDAFQRVNLDLSDEVRFSLPTAIVFSKIDLLEYHNTLGTEKYEYLWKPEYARLYNQDGEKIHALTRQLLQDLGEEELLSQERKLERMRFFSVSATGSAPENGSFKEEIRPHRCLDPLLWILRELDRLD